MREDIVVLGGGYAGVMAAVRMGRRLRGRARVQLVTARDALVERIRLHQRAARNHAAERPLRPLLARAGVELRVGRVSTWRPDRRELEVDGTTVRYDRVVYALGSATEVQRAPGVREHAHLLEPDSVARLVQRLPALAQRGGRLVVCGGGLTGIEVATELAESYPRLHVEIVTRGDAGDFLSDPARAYLRRAFDRLCVACRERVAVREVREAALVGDHEIPFDACIWAGGFVANPLARAAGLPVNDRGQLLLDDTLRVAAEPSVFGAGDAVAPGGCSLQMSCKIAMPMGAHAADVVSSLVEGGPALPFRYGDTGLCLSLGRRDGLIQFLGRDGEVRDRVWTGRAVAFVKESICRSTQWALSLEARGLARYRWFPGPALPAGREARRLVA